MNGYYEHCCICQPFCCHSGKQYCYEHNPNITKFDAITSEDIPEYYATGETDEDYYA